MTAIAKRKTADLTTVTPAPPPPERAEVDTTTKIETPVERFTAVLLGKWTPWLLSRMRQHWPHLTEWNFPGVIAEHIRSNGSLLIRSHKAIMLAVLTREAIEPRPVVDIVFMFKFHPEDPEHDKFVRPLFRQAEEWGRSNGARHVRLVDVDHIDLTHTKAKDIMGSAKDAGVLVKELDIDR